jgi:hypothetical protein
MVLRELFAEFSVTCFGLEVNAFRSEARAELTSAVIGMLVSFNSLAN